MTEGSTMVLDHFDHRSFSLFLKLFQSLSKLGGVISAQRFKTRFDGNQYLCSNVGGYGVSLIGCFGVVW